MKNIFSHFGKLFLQSFRTVKADKTLLRLPLVAGFTVLLGILLAGAGIAVAALLLRPEIFTGIDRESTAQTFNIDTIPKIAVYFFLFWLYMFVIYFCCVAFVSQLYQSVRRQPTGIRAGFCFAAKRSYPILLWALTQSIIQTGLRALELQNNLSINLATAILGLVWLFMCYFDIAGITADQTINNPLRVIRRSLSTLRTAWGEALLGFISFFLLTISAIFSGTFFCAIIFFIGMAVKILLWPAILLIVVGLLATLCLLFFIIAWAQGYQGLLYLSARGQLPGDNSTAAVPHTKEAQSNDKETP